MNGLSLCGLNRGPVVGRRGWTGGSHFLGWLVTHRPFSGKASPPPPALMARGSVWGPAVGGTAVIRGRGLGDETQGQGGDEALRRGTARPLGPWPAAPSCPGPPRPGTLALPEPGSGPQTWSPGRAERLMPEPSLGPPNGKNTPRGVRPCTLALVTPRMAQGAGPLRSRGSGGQRRSKAGHRPGLGVRRKQALIKGGM